MLALPADATDPKYAEAILDAVAAGSYQMQWAPVQSSSKGHTATFLMSADALKIDGVRWGMGASLMQQVADLIGAMLPTARLRDYLYAQRAVSITPVTIGMLGRPLNDLSKTDTMRAYSAAIDKLVGDRSGIVQTTGKPWILTNELLSHPGKACNYGWNVPGTSSNWNGVSIYPPASDPSLPFRVIQQPGFYHGLDQSDYSETATLVHRRCRVDGADRDLLDVLQDPELAPLASHEGVLKVLRQPGVPASCRVPGSAASAVAPGGNCPLPDWPTRDQIEGGAPGWVLPVVLGVGGVALAAGAWWAIERYGHHFLWHFA